MTQSGYRPLRGLCVDLSTGHAEADEQPAEVGRRFLGGRGLGAWLLLAKRVYDADPLGPDNALVFAPGPVSGSGAPSAGRYSVSSRSPLTGTLFDGNSGGALGTALRRLDLDYLTVSGACEAPAYLFLDAEGSRLLPAVDIWGLDVPATLAALKERHGRCEVALIGPAGEAGVLFASIVNNRGRQVGRGGLGAVMGAKRLKAVVVRAGRRRQPGPVDRERFASVIAEAAELLRADPITSWALPEFGTSVLVNVLNQVGALPTRNFRESVFAAAEQISGEALRAGFVERRSACPGCFIGCARRVRTTDGGGEGPQYESIWALGADCGIGDLGAIVEANQACNRLGLDTITMGATIACAMDLADLGALSGGPRFGDAGALLPLIEATAARHGRPELSMSVKGLELPAFDPRGMTGQGLAFATSNRGACHLRANMLGPEILGRPELLDRFATHGKAGPLIGLQDLNAVLDSLVECKFTAYALGENYFARLLTAAVGETIEPAGLLRAGERIWNAERLFNMRAGFTRADDALPRRLLDEPVPAGPSAGRVVDLEPMLAEYYAARGWDEDGRPTARKLTELSLEDAAPVDVRAGAQDGVTARRSP